MSNFSQFTTQIKSIQRGVTSVTFTASATSNTLNVAISAVDLTKSVISYGGQYTNAGTSSSSVASTVTSNATLTTTTNLKIEANALVTSAGKTVFIPWEIIEYY